MSTDKGVHGGRLHPAGTKPHPMMFAGPRFDTPLRMLRRISGARGWCLCGITLLGQRQPSVHRKGDDSESPTRRFAMGIGGRFDMVAGLAVFNTSILTVAGKLGGVSVRTPNLQSRCSHVYLSEQGDVPERIRRPRHHREYQDDALALSVIHS